MTMIKMTSLQAQSKFGELIDTSQREPVVITRHGRPISIVMSPNGNPQDISYQFKKLMSELYPLRGEEALAELDRVSAPVRASAKRQGLTEKKLNQLLNED
jgi:prevent-host-death family protein